MRSLFLFSILTFIPIIASENQTLSNQLSFDELFQAIKNNDSKKLNLHFQEQESPRNNRQRIPWHYFNKNKLLGYVGWFIINEKKVKKNHHHCICYNCRLKYNLWLPSEHNPKTGAFHPKDIDFHCRDRYGKTFLHDLHHLRYEIFLFQPRNPLIHAPIKYGNTSTILTTLIRRHKLD